MMSAGVTVGVGAGAALKLWLDRQNYRYRLPWRAVAAGSLVTVLAVPGIVYAGDRMAKADLSTFHEYWNGWEESVGQVVTPCHKDGSCKHTYNCDDTVTTTSNGTPSTTTYHHDCPYGTEEITYYLHTSLGDIVVSDHQFDSHTRQWGDWFHPLPDDVPTQPPADWEQARARINAGKPGPVTQVHDYSNWILAADNSTLRRYSPAISRYRTAGLLPDPAAGVHDLDRADKVHFVGVTPDAGTQAAWQDSAARVGARLGGEKQGDLQVVLVDSSKITNPDEYTASLLAYWTSPALGRDAISKNAVVVVAGTTDGSTVAWARAGTGMPVGNEALVAAAPDVLKGTAWTPKALLGSPDATLVNGKVASVVPGGGAVQTLLWGPDGYKRACMTCNGSAQGFSYLQDEIKPTLTQQLATGGVALLALAAIWGAVYALGRQVVPRRLPSGRYGRPRW